MPTRRSRRLRRPPTLNGLADPRTALGWFSALFISGGLAGFAVGTFPYWPIAHPMAGSGIAGAALVIGLFLWLVRRRAPRWSVRAAFVAGTASVSAAVWALGSGPQAQLPALYYGFLCLVAGAFGSRRLTFTSAALVGAAYLAALTPDWRVELATQWAIDMIAITLPAIFVNVLTGRLRALALCDPLTGLANRRVMDDAIPTAISRARRQKRPLSAAALDLDGLKSINDVAGHAAGDQLLISSARGFSRALRSDDVLARIGGDEFILLMPRTNLAEAQLAIQRLRAATPGIAFSAGVVRWTNESADQLLRRADAALYTAKQAGGNRTVADSPPVTTDQTDPKGSAQHRTSAEDKSRAS